MTKRSKLADMGSACIRCAAMLGANVPCVSLFYQPQMPKNLSQRLKKS